MIHQVFAYEQNKGIFYCLHFFLSLSLQFSLLIHVLRLSDLTNNFIHKKLDIYCIVKGVPYTMCIAR